MSQRLTPQAQWAKRQAALRAVAALFGIRADATDPTIAQYRARQGELVDASHAIIQAADAERRELTSDERKLIADNTGEVERLENEIDLRQRVVAQAQRLDAPQPRQAPANAGDPIGDDEVAPHHAGRPAAGRPHVQTVGLRHPGHASARGNGGFRNLADFAFAVRRAVQGAGMDDRLRNASLTTYGAEGVGADGGFAVPPDFRTEIMNLVQGEESLFSRVDAIPTSSNSVTVPTDETTAWGTSGVRVYSRAEAAAMTQSKPALKEITVRLNEIYALVPLTDELLEDSPMLSRLIATKAGEAMQFKMTDYIINGTGAGQPLGIANSGALVTVSKEASQAVDTIHAKNIAKMWSRMPAQVRNRSVWLMNQDCETQLMELGFQVQNPANNSATGGIPLFMPPGGLSTLPYSTLLGRPVITTEACATLGDLGDIYLAYLPGYFLPYKAGGIKGDVSMHLWFDQATTAYRWTFRFGGQPWLSAPISRKSGSNTLSHFITLEAR
jgi:HK97 family phage major capsid protein